jgi:hypothetical protein
VLAIARNFVAARRGASANRNHQQTQRAIHAGDLTRGRMPC